MFESIRSAAIIVLTTIILVACTNPSLTKSEEIEPPSELIGPLSGLIQSQKTPPPPTGHVSTVAASIKQLLPTRPLPEPPVDDEALARLLNSPPVEDRLSVRAGPGIGTALVTQVSRGDRLRELARQGDWVEVEVEGVKGARGWVHSDQVMTPSASSSGENVGAILVALPESYRVVPYDELDISVYNATDLDRRQMVRPDGYIDFPLVGEIMAAGKTPGEIRDAIVTGLTRSFDRPAVTVIVIGFRDRKLSVLGEVREPGSFILDSPTRVIDGLAMAGGFTKDADLRSASVVRNGKVLPVSIYRLIKHRDLRHNIPLMPRDSIIVPNISTRRVLVLGEVVNPTVVPMREDITLLEAVALARGFKRGAEKGAVLVIRGGIKNPQVISVNSEAFLSDGKSGEDLMLKPGDIVYVAKTWWAGFADFLADMRVTNQLTYIIHQAE